MRTTATLIWDTFREAFARKIFWGLFALSTCIILFFLFILKIDLVEGAVATISLLGGQDAKSLDVHRIVRQAQSGIATFLYSWGMLLAVFASSGLIPSVLEPGRIELLLSKPMRRGQILVGRYIGNVLVVGCNIAYLVLSVWAILGYKTGLWPKAFLLTIATTMFTFSVLLSVVIFIGVVFESAALATMLTASLMVASVILAQKTTMEKLLSSEWTRDLWRALYWTLPKVYDVGRMTLDFVYDRTVDGYGPIWSSALFAVAMLAVSFVVFSKRDF